MLAGKIEVGGVKIKAADMFGFADSLFDGVGNGIGRGNNPSAKTSRLRFAHADDLHFAVVRR